MPVFPAAASSRTAAGSAFVLISQNQMAAASNKRAELALQISLLADHDWTRSPCGTRSGRSNAKARTDSGPPLPAG